MEDQILRSIKRYIPDLVDMAMEERPDADRGSVEVTAAVMMLVSTIYMLNMVPKTPKTRAVIDAIVERLPRELEDRPVNLSQAILQPKVLEQAKEYVLGAYNTNLRGAFDAIYNARISDDLGLMGSMVNGPFGELGGVCIVTGKALVGEDKTPNMIGLGEIFSKHFSNVVDSIGGSGNKASGSKVCFVATACFGSPHEKTVVTLRQFREAVLKKYSMGRAFVKFYYRASPALAHTVSRNPFIRYLIAIVLEQIAKIIRYFFDLKRQGK